MDFRKLTVKELLDNPDTAAVIKELAPQLLKYPIKLLGKKKCGEIFDKVVATGIVPEVIAKEAEARINKILASRYIANRYPGVGIIPKSVHRKTPMPHRCRASERWNPTIE